MSASIGEKRADDLGEVFEIGGGEPIMHWDKEGLFAVENAGFDAVILGECF